MPVLVFGSWVLNEIGIIDLSSAMVNMFIVNEVFQIISVFEQSSFIKHVAFFTILCKINSGIHIYKFTFERLHFCFWMWFQRFEFQQKYGQVNRCGEKMAQIVGFAYPYSPTS